MLRQIKLNERPKSGYIPDVYGRHKQGCHNPGKSWKVLKLEKGPGKSWHFTSFCLKSWNFIQLLPCLYQYKVLTVFGILHVVFPSNIFLQV